MNLTDEKSFVIYGNILISMTLIILIINSLYTDQQVIRDFLNDYINILFPLSFICVIFFIV